MTTPLKDYVVPQNLDHAIAMAVRAFAARGIDAPGALDLLYARPIWQYANDKRLLLDPNFETAVLQRIEFLQREGRL